MNKYREEFKKKKKKFNKWYNQTTTSTPLSKQDVEDFFFDWEKYSNFLENKLEHVDKEIKEILVLLKQKIEEE